MDKKGKLTKSVLKRCKLCGEKKTLRKSHVIPKFIISWIKKTGSGFFRKAIKPNIRFQDISKLYLLCDECEQRFSDKEKYFSEQIFSPCIDTDSKQFDYSEDLHYFLISVLWRILIADFDLYKKEGKHFLKELKENEEDWRLYLLGKKSSVRSDVHLFITDMLDGDIPIKHFNQYMARGIDGCVGMDHTVCFVYSKFARFCIFSQLTEYDSSKWINTKIGNGKGTLSIPQKLLDGRIGDFFIDRIKKAYQMYNEKLSDKQREKIHENQKRNILKIANSDLGEALIRDSFSDIDKSFFPKRKIERNEFCPCGSGVKYKKCCLRN